MVIPWEQAIGGALGAIFGGGSPSGEPSPVGYSWSGAQPQQDLTTPLLIAGGIGVAVIVVVMLVK